jgi:hypothetical protein
MKDWFYVMVAFCGLLAFILAGIGAVMFLWWLVHIII